MEMVPRIIAAVIEVSTPPGTAARTNSPTAARAAGPREPAPACVVLDHLVDHHQRKDDQNRRPPGAVTDRVGAWRSKVSIWSASRATAARSLAFIDAVASNCWAVFCQMTV